MGHIRKDDSRCARLRTSTEACGRCLAECSTGALEVADRIEVDASTCTHCGRCASVCPSGAISWEPPVQFGRMLAHVARPTHSVIGCTKSTTPGRLDAGACLGWLTEEHLCALATACTVKVQLDLTQCEQCINGHILNRLGNSLRRAEQNSRLPVRSRVALVVRSEDRWQDADCMDRRRLFSLWRNILQPQPDGFPALDCGPSAHRDKALPARRRILQWVADRNNGAVASAIAMNYYGSVDIDCACETCGACAAACPSGALDMADDRPSPRFDPARCTGCGACEAFCSHAAITVRTQAATSVKRAPTRGAAVVEAIAS